MHWGFTLPSFHTIQFLSLPSLVTFIGKGGYWEGKVEGKEGWFPRLAIKEFGDEEFDYATLSRATGKAKAPVNPEPSFESKDIPTSLPNYTPPVNEDSSTSRNAK